MPHEPHNAAELSRVCHRGVQRHAASLRRPAEDDAPAVAAVAGRLLLDQRVEPGAHLQEAAQLQVVLRAAGPVREVVEPRAELDGPPADALSAPHVPVLEAGLLEQWRRGHHHPDCGVADAEVVGEVQVVRALAAETVQVNQGPFRLQLQSMATRLEHNGTLEFCLTPANHHGQILPDNGAADALEATRGRYLERLLALRCRRRPGHAIERAILVPADSP
mmetsp:Transcript_94176/g.263120  ORF Transcript_94176/g.263120 Transcript_94176/m.263120 type:complete len:220 (+) Transcript_94176:355-1014(+)